MPAAHLMVQSVGSANSLLQQLQHQHGLANGLAQCQPNALSDQLNSLSYLSAYQQPISDEARRAANAHWATINARSAAENGNTLIARMAFWSAFGLLAKPIMSRLAVKLDRVSDDVERYIGIAA